MEYGHFQKNQSNLSQVPSTNIGTKKADGIRWY